MQSSKSKSVASRGRSRRRTQNVTVVQNTRVPRYIPRVKRPTGYNLQFVKVKRIFDFCVPPSDLNRATNGTGYGCYPYIAGTALSNSVNSYVNFAFTFRLGDVPQITELGALFDQFKISYVKLDFDYISGTGIDTPQNISPSNSICTLAYVNDFDDSTAFAASNDGWNKLLETGRAKVRRFPNNAGNRLSISFKPKYRGAALDATGTLVTSTISSSDWLDGAISSNTEHYGVKGLLQIPPCNTSVDNEHNFKVMATYYLEFKNRQ